jgi:hypothetical protein
MADRKRLIRRSNYSLIIPIVITIALIILRLTKVITLNWWWVLSPVILLSLFIIGVVILLVKVAYLFDWYH